MAIIPLSTPTAIRDRSILDVDTLKLHLRLNGTTFDTLLQIYLDAAKTKADVYCQNTFTKNGTEQDIPADVEVWLLQTAARFYMQAENNISAIKLDNMDIDYTIDNYDVDYAGLKFYRIETGMGLIY